jgi:hypothetical protein
MEYYSTFRNEEISSICDNMDKSEGHYAKEISQVREILHDFTCMWNLKIKKK